MLVFNTCAAPLPCSTVLQCALLLPKYRIFGINLSKLPDIGDSLNTYRTQRSLIGDAEPWIRRCSVLLMFFCWCRTRGSGCYYCSCTAYTWHRKRRSSRTAIGVSRPPINSFVKAPIFSWWSHFMPHLYSSAFQFCRGCRAWCSNGTQNLSLANLFILILVLQSVIP